MKLLKTFRQRETWSALGVDVLFILVIFGSVFLQGCATLQSLTQPQYGEFTITYSDGDVITYLLPPEFSEMNQDQAVQFPVSVGYVGYATCIRQEIDGNVYAIFVTMDENAEIFGAASIVGEEQKWWIYTDGKPSDKSCSYDDFLNYATQFITGTLKPNLGV